MGGRGPRQPDARTEAPICQGEIKCSSACCVEQGGGALPSRGRLSGGRLPVGGAKGDSMRSQKRRPCCGGRGDGIVGVHFVGGLGQLLLGI